MKKVVVSGLGKMGQTAMRELTKKGFEVNLGIDLITKAEMNCTVYTSRQILSKQDDEEIIEQMKDAALVCFSNRLALDDELKIAKIFCLPIFIGTTGLTKDDMKKIEIAAEEIPIIQSGNFSISVLEFVERCVNEAIRLVSKYGIENVKFSIEEVHHINKLDAPSGTALLIFKKILEVMQEKFGYDLQAAKQPLNDTLEGYDADQFEHYIVPIYSVRMGSEPGTHRLKITTPNEKDNCFLEHIAKGREEFASGIISILKQSEKCKNMQPGLYQDVLSLIRKGW